jgi:hypothetical protein
MFLSFNDYLKCVEITDVSHQILNIAATLRCGRMQCKMRTPELLSVLISLRIYTRIGLLSDSFQQYTSVISNMKGNILISALLPIKIITRGYTGVL